MVSVEPIDRAPPPVASFSGRRILIVDDEPEVQSTLARVLRYEGVEVETASCLDEAAEKVRSGPSFDAAVVDYWLFGERSPNLIAQLRGSTKPCCTLLITGTRNFDIGREAIASGAEDFLLKPFTVPDFLAAVERTIEHTDAWRRRLVAAEPILESPPGQPVLRSDAPDQSLRRGMAKVPLRLMTGQDLSEYVHAMGEALDLSKKQKPVFQRLIAGDPVDAIATDLGVTTRTVKYHACRIYKKAGVHSRVELQSVLFDR
jgi:DNA-binding NarL/FixJ family response regulator